jgi:PHD/YefM family antitoxin component YafN of YafNO toxin-antitoxin module
MTKEQKRRFMLKTKYDVLVRNGKERFVVVPEKEYQAMRDRIEDEIDFRAIEASKKRQANSPRYTLDQIKRELGMPPSKRKRKA